MVRFGIGWGWRNILQRRSLPIILNRLSKLLFICILMGLFIGTWNLKILFSLIILSNWLISGGRSMLAQMIKGTPSAAPLTMSRLKSSWEAPMITWSMSGPLVCSATSYALDMHPSSPPRVERRPIEKYWTLIWNSPRRYLKTWKIS